jgi:hypothetical protein
VWRRLERIGPLEPLCSGVNKDVKDCIQHAPSATRSIYNNTIESDVLRLPIIVHGKASECARTPIGNGENGSAQREQTVPREDDAVPRMG